MIPESTETHHPLGNLHLAERFHKNIGLQRHIFLTDPLGAAGVHEHVHSEIGGIPVDKPCKQPSVPGPSHLPQKAGDHLPVVVPDIFHLAATHQGPLQNVGQNGHVPLCQRVVLIIIPLVLLRLPQGVLIIIIVLNLLCIEILLLQKN